eukprot:TRINITY_DN2652_c0_g1_i2.p1 TRINITY_DN2652_c0_g1~~TRINITY_DN2652_c0_g1_i2.p1  ORF type:complete len:403 (+),score=38.52 TRINITY_DN2652_c0_g1_i2:173-1381(+)
MKASGGGLLLGLVLLCTVVTVWCNIDLCLLHTGHTLGLILSIDAYNGGCPPNTTAGCTGGIARRGTIIETARATCGADNTLLLDSGSFYGGDLFYLQFGVYAIAYYYKALAYDAVALGTHDFYTGLKDLWPFMVNASVPAISANMGVQGEPLLRDTTFPYKVWVKNGTKVGYTAEISSDFLKSAGGNGGNVTVIDSTVGIRAAVGEMLRQHVKVVVVGITSLNITSIYALLDSCYGINYIIYETENIVGNTSTDSVPIEYTTIWGSRVLLTGDGSLGQRLAWLNLTFDDDGELLNYTGASKILYDNIPDDPTVTPEIAIQYQIIQDSYGTVVGSTSMAAEFPNSETCCFYECAICNYHADAYRRYRPGTDFTIVNGGTCGYTTSLFLSLSLSLSLSCIQTRT